MKKILLIAAILITGWSTGLAQDTYFTQNAILQINGELNKEPLRLQTSELGVALDYETAYIIIRFPVRSLQTNVDSLNEMFAKSNLEIVFDGKLGLEYINTEDHPPMKFTTEGWLTIGTSKVLVEGKGELHHIGKAVQYACMLGMTMQLSFEKLNIDLPIPGLDNEFEVVIRQALLENNKN